jgi:hypothetical protein
LHGVEAPAAKRTIIELSRDTFQIDPAPFLQLLDAREQKVALKSIDPALVLAAYLRELSIVIDAVDRLEK